MNNKLTVAGKQNTMHAKKIIITAVILIAVLFVLAGWKLPITLKIEKLNLPDGCETVYHTKVQISDVYWLHVTGEKVIKCDLGYEAVKEYIETHNSPSMLANIDIYEYSGMSDTAVYDSQFDENFWKQPDCENYITISYFRILAK